MAANGVDLSEGTPLNILTDTDYFSAIDTNTIRNNAEREAWGHREQGKGASAQASLARAQGASQSGLFNAAGTLLSGASAVADKWYRYKTGNTGVYIG
jgi:hypothetical protein